MKFLSPEIRHFHYRAGFGVGISELPQHSDNRSYSQVVDEAIEESIQRIEVEELMQGSPVRNEAFFSENNDHGMQYMETASTQLDQLRGLWMDKMIGNDACLAEKMTLFWHTHFACQCSTERIALQYLNVLRKHALGNFRSLLHEVAKSPAMIIFLNNLQNRRDHPNENFARELMEIFTMGRGNYSETDVKESARAFTGWSADRQGNFLFREQNHDFEQKTFLGVSGRLDGTDIIDLILKQPATTLFLAKKLYHYFVSEIPNSDHIQRIAREIKAHDYEMSKVMHFLFTSRFFADPQNIGNRIKSPIELLVQVARLFKIEYLNPTQVSFLQKALGQLLFDPPNVSGWAGGRSWINNSTLMLRLNLVRYLINRERFDHAVSTPLEAMATGESIQIVEIKHDHSALLDRLSGTRYDRMEELVKNLLLATDSPTPSISKPRDFRDLDFTLELVLKVVSLPEFQMS
ncbi:MAG: DUF1800 domain-containing protein [Saprospiraceae bacterium]|nr:DUF1800 domain-containing protein [Saprospiraceae bacterium]